MRLRAQRLAQGAALMRPLPAASDAFGSQKDVPIKAILETAAQRARVIVAHARCGTPEQIAGGPAAQFDDYGRKRTLGTDWWAISQTKLDAMLGQYPQALGREGKQATNSAAKMG
jgi:hypothetical protein